MGTINDRIREARKRLGVSQGYVAQHLGIGRSAVAEIEAGRRKVSAEELGKLSELFLVPAEALINGRGTEPPSHVFARSFDALGAEDQQEILNLMEFKLAMRARSGA